MVAFGGESLKAGPPNQDERAEQALPRSPSRTFFRPVAIQALVAQEHLNPFIPESHGYDTNTNKKGFSLRKSTSVSHLRGHKRRASLTNFGWCLRSVFTANIKYAHHKSFLWSQPKSDVQALRATGISISVHNTRALGFQNSQSPESCILKQPYPSRAPSSLSNLNNEISSNTPELC